METNEAGGSTSERPSKLPETTAESDHQEYAGFWIRVGATLIDTLLILLIVLPLLTSIYGWSYWDSAALVQGFWDVVLNYLLPAFAVVVFWYYRSATPGKIALKLRIVDARSGNKPTLAQFVIRYLGYFVSTIPLGLGLIWVGIDRRKQAWHDKLAGTVVLHDTRHEPVVFDAGAAKGGRGE
jgi:uncharacterized RDD family membrane protein YckC